MLVQKPPSFNLNAPPVRHRRHPSSPPVVLVQPTQIPGLLTLSKPQQQQQPRSSLRAKAAPSTPSPASKSRPAKDKHATPPSRSAPSQAEGPSDPFFVPPQSNPKPRNTRRRQPISIPVPSTQPQTARSVPLPHHRPAKRTVAPEPLLPAFNLRVCDDMSDHEASSDAPALVTPTRPKQHRPHPSPPQQPQPIHHSKRRPRHHKRVPSDSGIVFHMSSDESGPETLPNKINVLFQGIKLPSTPPPAQREFMYEAMAQREVQGYFASSSFQNSPSPEELPDPEFV
ncbi:hypothetical protein C0989_007329 [Termitomyces sp. Mn162]|nr:hypothetical protein C0989_007329 [Termitomyces sp. Mn162]